MFQNHVSMEKHMSKKISVVLFEDDKADGKVVEASIKKALGKDGSLIRFDLTATPKDEGELRRSYEDRIIDSLEAQACQNAVLLVTDRDLSKNDPYRGLSEAVISRVADKLGFPVALYARGVTDSIVDRKRIWGDGRVILDYTQGADVLGRQAACAARGFDAIRQGLTKAGSGSKDKTYTPARIMARLLGKANLSDKIALYGAGDQGMLSEALLATKREEAARRQVRILGYWLWDSILRFPGILLREISAASYLNITVGSFQHAKIQKAFSKALYRGPFSDQSNPCWWRADLDELLTSVGCSDGREYIGRKSGGKLPPPCQCSVNPSLRQDFYRPWSTPHSRSELADYWHRNYLRGQPKTSCLSLRHKRRCSAARPEDFVFACGDPIPPSMSPLRAVVSRGHIAFSNHNSSAHSLSVSVGLRESPSDCTARCAPSRYCSFLCSTLTVLAPPTAFVSKASRWSNITLTIHHCFCSQTGTPHVANHG